MAPMYIEGLSERVLGNIRIRPTRMGPVSIIQEVNHHRIQLGSALFR